MGDEKSIIGRMKHFSYALRALFSFLALFTLHLVALREFLLGSLSGLADSVFFFDAAFDLVGAVILATVAARLAFLWFFTGFWGDQINLISRLLRYLYRSRIITFVISLRPKRGLSQVSELDIDANYNSFLGFITDHAVIIEAVLTLVFFCLIYFGSFFSIFSSLALLAFLVLLLLIVSQILLAAQISLFSDISINGFWNEPRKMTVIIAVVSSLSLVLAVAFAYARAKAIFGSNVVSVTYLLASDAECLVFLGKSADGVFFFIPSSKTPMQFLQGCSLFHMIRSGT